MLLCRIPCWASLVLVVAMTGCTGPEKPNVVKGQVTYKGAPLPTGTISFIDDKGGTAGSGGITDGVYRVEKLPLGAMKVTVRTPPPQSNTPPPPGTALAGPQQKIVPIPDHYGNADKSGLTYTVTKDHEQTYNVELK